MTDVIQVQVISGWHHRRHRIGIAYGRGIRFVDTSEAITTAVRADRPFSRTFGLFAPVVRGVTTLVESADRGCRLAVPAVGTCLSDALDTPSMDGVEGHVHNGMNSMGSRQAHMEN